ncbi:hypothetical protein Agub_g11188 [Astrephomene gubernaculifera]|uniref:Uncharacterized protein n=1 Tax=Astrephomene gubernaculifera TaxID=47775 RepID=A0AAD3DW77_9CHLO|nr:hypothetical protein Agub_g11188 [Astrephomene gubernaculifera]
MPPLSKKALKGLRAREANHEDPIDYLGGCTSESGTAGELTGDFSDEDCFSQASLGRSSYSDADYGRELLDVHNTIYQLLEHDDAERAGKEKVQYARRRLREAIDAEHVFQLEEHCSRFRGDRKSLHKDGVIIFGISVQNHKSTNCFTLKRHDGESFLGHFGLRKRVTIFKDLGEPTGAKESSTAAASAASQPTSSEAHVTDNSCAKAERGVVQQEEEEEAVVVEEKLPGEGTGMPDKSTTITSSSEVRDALHNNVRKRLNEIGIVRQFDGVVIQEISPQEIVIKSRYEFAARMVDDANEEAVEEDDGEQSDTEKPINIKDVAHWAVAGDLQDCTFRRQAAAAESLGTFLSVKEVSPVTGCAIRRDEEVRLRKIILCDPASGEDKEFARSAATQGVEWLSEKVQAELHAVLAAPRLGLNEEQLSVLKQAAGRSLTLMQGPPGTGKTYTLAAMAAALCQVFHDPNGTGDLESGTHEFEIPSSKDMKDWTPEEVVRWIESFQDRELVWRALRGTTGHTGKAIMDHRTKRLRHLLTRSSSSSSNSSSSSDDDDSPEELERVKRYTEEFKRLRSATLEAIEQCQQKRGRWNTGFWRTADRDMRIIMCADTNTAANRLLEQLVGLLPPESSYSIVRMGVMDELTDGGGLEGKELATKYHIDSRRRNHPLEQAREKMFNAMERKKLTKQMATELKGEILAFAERKLVEAENESHRALVRKSWEELATLVKNDIAPRIETLTGQFLSSRKGDTRREARQALKDLQLGLRELALHDIMISVQVVVGTNTSIGELQYICEKKMLSFPIVLMDEAGQSSEPSSIIPLTLGAEWVLMGGDLKQLPPTLHTDVAKKVLGYDTRTAGSQYGRFAGLNVLELSLSRQYRMHPAIRDFPSRCFYDNKLFEDPQRPPDMRVPQPRLHGCSFKWPSEKQGRGEYPLAFFDVPYGVEQQEDKSYFNEEEASLAMQLMMAFACDPTVQSIVIISTYKAQVTYMNKRLDAARGFLSLLRKQGKFHASTVKASTVDGFQGHEADVVIISTVRNNGAGRLGHVADWRRLNVAVTRARRALLLVGSIRTANSVLMGTPSKGGYHYANYWPRLIEHIRRYGDAVVEGRDANEYTTLVAALPKEMACTYQDLKKLELLKAAEKLLDHAKSSTDRQRKEAQKCKGKKQPKRREAEAGSADQEEHE